MSGPHSSRLREVSDESQSKLQSICEGEKQWHIRTQVVYVPEAPVAIFHGVRTLPPHLRAMKMFSLWVWVRWGRSFPWTQWNCNDQKLATIKGAQIKHYAHLFESARFVYLDKRWACEVWISSFNQFNNRAASVIGTPNLDVKCMMESMTSFSTNPLWLLLHNQHWLHERRALSEWWILSTAQVVAVYLQAYLLTATCGCTVPPR